MVETVAHDGTNPRHADLIDPNRKFGSARDLPDAPFGHVGPYQEFPLLAMDTPYSVLAFKNIRKCMFLQRESARAQVEGEVQAKNQGQDPSVFTILRSGGDNDFNYESHTLLIQTFARGSWLGARLST